MTSKNDDELTRYGFLSTMSHELRTPMNGLHGNLAFLEELGLDGAAKEALTDARSSLDRLDALVERMILLASLEDSSRLEPNAPRPPEPGTVRSLASVFDEATQELRWLMEEKSIDFQLRGYRAGVRLTAGGEEIRVICRELLSNAVKYTREGSIEVRFGLVWDISRSAQNPFVHLTVEDHGCGIDPIKLKRLTEPFERTDVELNRSQEGLGIGLAIVRQQVASCDGNFHIRSSPGAGTVVYVDLPIRIIAADERRFSPRTESSDRPLRVLVAEDNAINARVVLRLLERTTAQATWVENGAEAVRAVERATFDVILMDLQMPVMDGIEATRRIRARQGPHPVIVALTANDSPEERRACFDVGMDGFIAKPLRPANLTALLGAFEGV